jgi:transcriptional regulator with XRE-family HTH domain
MQFIHIKTVLMNSFTTNPLHQGLYATRIRLGFSQEEFGRHLGISRALVGLAENRKRSLPTAALVKLAGLEILMAGPAQTKEDLPVHPAETAPLCFDEHSEAAIHYKEVCCRTEAQMLQVKLTQMEARYKQVRRSLDVIEQLLEAQNESEKENFGLAYLNLHRYNLCRKIQKCSLPAQAALRNKVALLFAAAELHKASLQEFYQSLSC